MIRLNVLKLEIKREILKPNKSPERIPDPGIGKKC
jgi:hypothetical protein